MAALIRSILPAHTTLGVEITDTQIKMCELQSSGRHIRVTAALHAALPEGAMNDGRIQDIAALRHTIQKLLDQRKWKTKHVHFAIPSQSVMVRLLKLPDVSYKDMSKIVHFEMNNNIHLPFDDPHYDFVKLKRKDEPAPKQNKPAAIAQAAYKAEAVAAAERPDPFGSEEPPQQQQGTTCDVMLIAASLDVIHQYMQLFAEMDLRLRSIEIKAFSLRRLLERSMASIGGELALLADVNATTCDLTIVQHGVVKLTRNVPVSMTAQPTVVNHSGDDLFADFLPKAESTNGSFNDLVAEIERFMNFYRYTLNNREQEFERLVLSGDIPMIGDLHQFLSGRMTLPVTMLPSAVMGGGSFSDQDAFYAVPLGLCLRGTS